MDIRFQFLFLKLKIAMMAAIFLFASSISFAAQDSVEDIESDENALDINNEVFELGAFTGIINIENFTSAVVGGLGATFRASEDFFIQYNYLRANVSLTSFEKTPQFGDGGYTLGDRNFVHYDLLVGYNLFQGEFFPSPAKTNLSSLYVVAGVGDTEFGGESSMTYIFGIGYQVALSRHLGLHFDFKDYLYKSSIITEKSEIVKATQISAGLKYLF
jgi:outer membrane beta-barrel protein